MPDKKENMKKIKSDYYTDLAFAEKKINSEEFERRHKWGNKEKWEEVKYVALNSIFLTSFLLELGVERRLRAVKDLYGYSFEELKILGKFGGSIHNFFKNEHGYTEDRLLTEPRCRLAITLDIPVVFLLKDKPTLLQRQQYDFLEYNELARKITMSELKNILVRPVQREIAVYKIELNKDTSFFKMEGISEINCRLDFHKTFYSIEFHLHSQIDVDLNFINKLVEEFDNKVFRIILIKPLLRDTYKLSIICTFREEQKERAKKYSEDLININKGILLYPYNYNFDFVVPI